MSQGHSQGETYTSPNQSRKLAAFSAITALAVVPLSADQGTTVVSVVFEFIATVIAKVVFGIVGFLFAKGTEQFLFFPPPARIVALNQSWNDFAFLFAALLPVVGSAFFLGQMIFPEKEEADIYRFIERSLVAGIALVITGPLGTISVEVGNNEYYLDLFSASVAAVNEIGKYIFPPSYSMNFLAGNLNAIMGAIAGVIVAFAAVAAAKVAIGFLISVVIVIGTFWLILAMRMLLVYTVYAMMPLLLVLWIVDIGPMQYGKQVSVFVWKITALLLLFGIVISGVLSVSNTIATQDNAALYEGDPPDQEGYISGNGSVNPAIQGQYDTGGGTASDGSYENGMINNPDAGTNGASRALFQLLAWFGGPATIIGVTVSLGSVLISGLSGGQSGGRRGSSESRTQRVNQTQSSGGQKLFGGGNDGTATATNGQGDTIIQDGDDSVTINNDGDFEASTDNSPQPDAVPLRNKAGHQVKRADSALGGYGQRTVDEAKSIGKGRYERVPDSVKTGMNLLKRGGSAYTSVLAEDTAYDSLTETHRIATESDILQPPKPEDEVKDAGSSAGQSFSEDELTDVTLEDISDDESAFEDGVFNLKNVKYEHTDSYSGDGDFQMRKGRLVDQDTGEEYPHVNLDQDGPGYEGDILRDGEVYDLNDVQMREYTASRATAHAKERHDDSVRSYNQIQTRPSTTATKKSSSNSQNQRQDRDQGQRQGQGQGQNQRQDQSQYQNNNDDVDNYNYEPSSDRDTTNAYEIGGKDAAMGNGEKGKMDDRRVDLEGVEYQHKDTTSRETDDGDTEYEIDRGDLVDPDSGIKVPYINHGPGEFGGPELEDGETYDLSDAELGSYNSDYNLAHDRFETPDDEESQNYLQIRADESTGVQQSD